MRLRMSADVSQLYQEAIKALNGLQTNAATMQKTSQKSPKDLIKKLRLTNVYAERCGVPLSELKGKIIHVAGTKGKGSTSAFCESILRSFGYKTGFFSSPHLIEVRERIRINGAPLTQSQFTEYFWPVYTSLHAKKATEDDMPFYFKFLTVMAYKVFIEENVDVAIVEVGIGGEYDCTNIFSETPVVGITAIGHDHMNTLGNRLEDIAWHKAGILKPNCIAWTCAGQAPEVLKVLRDRAIEKQCTLQIAPLLTPDNMESTEISNLGQFQQQNASLAVQLAHSWLTKSTEPCLSIDGAFQKGIRECRWPGRYQIVQSENITFHIDGAHTEESALLCSKWFKQAISCRNEAVKVLVFNSTGDRDITSLLQPFLDLKFDLVYFCPNIASTSSFSQDTVSKKLKNDQRPMLHYETWKMAGGGKAAVVPSVSDAIASIRQIHSPCCVLVTGSLHLVGALLSVLNYKI